MKTLLRRRASAPVLPAVRIGRLALSLAGLLVAACTGELDPGDGSPDLTFGGAPAPGPGAPEGVGRPSPGEAPTMTPTARPSARPHEPLRRLTRREYDATVRDLLGDASAPASRFPAEREKDFVFSRAGAVSELDAALLRDAAESLAAAAVPKLGEVAPCDVAALGEAACARELVTRFGLRAFRRPLKTEESDRLLLLYQRARAEQGLAHADALGLLIEAMLQAPPFLYHHREDPPGAAEGAGEVLRGPYEMASRLSYSFWGSMPDQPLFEAAAAGALDTEAAIEAQARRLLADPRAREPMLAFVSEWLDLDALPERAKDEAVYKEWNDALRAAMTAEARLFVDSVVFAEDARLATLLGASFSFVDRTLAPIYGAPAPVGLAHERVILDARQRRGLLTQSAFLAASGATDGSDPVHRGKLVFERLLCGVLPPPPPEVPPPKPASAGGTTRSRLAEHSQAECAVACHALFDPLGFAFEHYDGIGRYRTTDNGLPVDASGAVTLDGERRSFTDAIGLTGLLAESEEVRRCFTTQWLRFALGRPEAEADAPSIAAAAARLAASGGDVRELMVAIATSRAFRARGAQEVAR